MERPVRARPAEQAQRRRKLQAAKLHLEAGLERRHLAFGVHTCVRPRGAMNDVSLTEQDPQRILERALDGREPWLLLPAAKCRSVVGEQQGER